MKILIVDDDRAIAESLAEALAGRGVECTTVNDGRRALEQLASGHFDIALLDLVMPEKNGIEVLAEAKQFGCAAEFVVITGFGSIETAIEAMKQGASDYLTKPVNLEELRLIVRRVAENSGIKKENARLRKLVLPEEPLRGMIGVSPKIQKIRETILQIAPRRVTVLIEGESGTGKEIVADGIARLSGRQDKPFLRKNCGAISQGILESELFGHEKGSFTGAVAQKKGIFEAAHGGTLFLDEIGEMPVESQVRLLRVLETGEFTRVGGVTPITADVRIIAATNKDLKQQIDQGLFREDLYYRLNVVKITLPPLRERREDIPFLAQHFLNVLNAENKTEFRAFDPDVLALLTVRNWPGNIRELRNTIERILLFAQNEIIRFADLPDDLTQEEICKGAADEYGTMAEIEKRIIERTLRQTENNARKTSRILNIPLRTLYRKLKNYNLN
ncbi:MAG: sigma-54 dependent transcriptional regulator [Spirochaetota bacterium]|jgi:DNA-binding NtrC family response regulator|nr:sigma-54 dependent transcriptional regulator [Spirochaetota bacterium]